ncbi:MAG TPA: DUF3606 domain-containing protein [Polaromonas sp.]|uniref:DUF3606 domain-containing protein n=1 Tax=Polaromonas sp. TaxID=1869339 RepID=UPI002D41C85C|nr:DUF3606 domain-containing protein [Polaromonas sp.]HYW58419.1 DUF3606 domain-containing protein [Polaromonas sp.]
MRPQHSNRAPADAQRVNVYEPWEELYWGEKLRCTSEQLRAAVDAVGVSVADVKAYLDKSKRSHGSLAVHPSPSLRHQMSAQAHKLLASSRVHLFQ